jgi:hypothetical protein
MLDNFEFFMVKPIHYDEVIDHLKENFFYDEPLNHAVGLCREKGESNPELEKHSLATVRKYFKKAFIKSLKLLLKVSI